MQLRHPFLEVDADVVDLDIVLDDVNLRVGGFHCHVRPQPLERGSRVQVSLEGLVGADAVPEVVQDF